MTQTCYWCLEFGHSYCNFFYFYLNLHHNSAKHGNPHKITPLQTQKSNSVHEKSEEFDVISAKILPSEEGDTARDPTEATLWVERVDTEGEKVDTEVETVDTEEIFS